MLLEYALRCLGCFLYNFVAEATYICVRNLWGPSYTLMLRTPYIPSHEPLPIDSPLLLEPRDGLLDRVGGAIADTLVEGGTREDEAHDEHVAVGGDAHVEYLLLSQLEEQALSAQNITVSCPHTTQ